MRKFNTHWHVITISESCLALNNQRDDFHSIVFSSLYLSLSLSLSLSHFFVSYFFVFFPLLFRPKLVIESDLDRTLEASFELRAVIEKAHYEMRSLKFRENSLCRSKA